MDRFDSMTAFTKVVECGGFAGAARRLDLSPSAVTTRVQGIEDKSTDWHVKYFPKKRASRPCRYGRAMTRLRTLLRSRGRDRREACRYRRRESPTATTPRLD